MPHEEVKRVCNAIGLSDWSEKTDPTVSEEKELIEAQNALNQAVAGQLKKRI